MQQAASTARGNKRAIHTVCTVVRLANDIVFSLNVYGLSIVMEQHMEAWLTVWKTWLEFHDACLVEADDDVESAECEYMPGQKSGATRSSCVSCRVDISTLSVQ
jgi:hypothetical protein